MTVLGLEENKELNITIMQVINGDLIPLFRVVCTLKEKLYAIGQINDFLMI